MKFLRTILFLTTIAITSIALPSNEKINDLTILVSSCDRYSKLWPSFFELLFKNWPSLKTYDKNIPIILVSNTEIYHDPRVTTILSPVDLNWTGNVREALEHVKTKYILYLQDDYLIISTVLDDKIATVLKTMQEDHLQHVGLYQHYFEANKNKLLDVPNSNLLKYKNHDMPYLTSLQAAIWDKSTFKEFLDQKKTNVWDFEDRRLNDNHKFAFYAANPKPIYYINFMNLKSIRFNPYCLMYYRGYNLDFANSYPIGGKARFGKEIEWLRRNMPRTANFIFYSWGFCIDFSMSIKGLSKIVKEYL